MKIVPAMAFGFQPKDRTLTATVVRSVYLLASGATWQGSALDLGPQESFLTSRHAMMLVSPIRSLAIPRLQRAPASFWIKSDHLVVIGNGSVVVAFSPVSEATVEKGESILGVAWVQSDHRVLAGWHHARERGGVE